MASIATTIESSMEGSREKWNFDFKCRDGKLYFDDERSRSTARSRELQFMENPASSIPSNDRLDETEPLGLKRATSIPKVKPDLKIIEELESKRENLYQDEDDDDNDDNDDDDDDNNNNNDNDNEDNNDNEENNDDDIKEEKKEANNETPGSSDAKSSSEQLKVLDNPVTSLTSDPSVTKDQALVRADDATSKKTDSDIVSISEASIERERNRLYENDERSSLYGDPDTSTSSPQHEQLNFSNNAPLWRFQKKANKYKDNSAEDDTESRKASNRKNRFSLDWIPEASVCSGDSPDAELPPEDDEDDEEEEEEEEEEAKSKISDNNEVKSISKRSKQSSSATDSYIYAAPPGDDSKSVVSTISNAESLARRQKLLEEDTNDKENKEKDDNKKESQKKEKEPEEDVKAPIVMGWEGSEADNDSYTINTNDDDHTEATHKTTSLRFNAVNNSNGHASFSQRRSSVIEQDDVYEDFGMDRSRIKKEREISSRKNLLAEEEYDPKKPWLKAPLPQSNNNHYHSHSTESYSDDGEEFSNDSNVIQTLDELDAKSYALSVRSEDGIKLARDCLTLYEDINRVSEFFTIPDFEQILSKPEQQETPPTKIATESDLGNTSNKDSSDINEDGEEINIADLDWLQQVQPLDLFKNAVISRFAANRRKSATSTGESMRLSSNILANLRASVRGDMSGNADADSVGSNESISQLIEGAKQSWLNVKNLIGGRPVQQDSILNDSINFDGVLDPMTKPNNNTDETESASGDEENPHKNDHADPVKQNEYTYNDDDDDKSKSSIDYKLQFDIDGTFRKSNLRGFRCSTIYEKYFRVIAWLITFLLICGVVVGAVFISETFGKDDGGKPPATKPPEETSPPIPPTAAPKKVGWDHIYTLEGHGTGTVSVSADGEKIAFNINQVLTIFEENEETEELQTCYHCEIEAMSTKSNILLSPDGEYLVEILTNDASGHVIVRTIVSPYETWTPIVDQYLNLTVASASVSNNCRLAIGVPTNSFNGASGGLGRVYDFCAAAASLTQIGNDILGTPDSITGNSVSLSQNGRVLAVASELVSDSGHSSGEVQVYFYHTATGKWRRLGNLLEGRQNDDNFGSSVSLSGDGRRVAVGAKGHNIEMENIIDNIYDAGFCKVYELSENENGTYWNPIGTTILGENYQDKVGAHVHISADGRALFVGAATLFLKSYRWGEYDWNRIEPDISMIHSPTFLSSSEDGWRLGMGFVNTTLITQFEYINEE